VHEGGRNPAFLFSPYGTKAEGRLFVVPFLLLRQLADSQGKAGSSRYIVTRFCFSHTIFFLWHNYHYHRQEEEQHPK